MTEPLPQGTAWAYGSHVHLSLWDSSPVPGGPTYREIAAGKAATDKGHEPMDSETES